MQCPYCGGRSFWIDATIRTRLTVECTEDGDYREIDDNRTDCVWHGLTCRDCGRAVDEGEARAAFEAGPPATEHHP